MLFHESKREVLAVNAAHAFDNPSEVLAYVDLALRFPFAAGIVLLRAEQKKIREQLAEDRADNAAAVKARQSRTS